MLKRNPHGLLCQGPRVGGCREETERTSSAWKRFVAVALPARRAPLAKKAFIKKDTCIGLAEGHHFNPAAHLCTHPPPPLCVTSQNQPSSSLLFFRLSYASPGKLHPPSFFFPPPPPPLWAEFSSARAAHCHSDPVPPPGGGRGG